MGARKRAGKAIEKVTPSARDYGCLHRDVVMLVYLGGLNALEHDSLHWCTDCGSVCRRRQVGGQTTEETWAYTAAAKGKG